MIILRWGASQVSLFLKIRAGFEGYLLTRRHCRNTSRHLALVHPDRVDIHADREYFVVDHASHVGAYCKFDQQIMTGVERPAQSAIAGGVPFATVYNGACMAEVRRRSLFFRLMFIRPSLEDLNSCGRTASD